jgi:hypothetical protein
MKNIHKKAKRSNFLLAAEGVFIHHKVPSLRVLQITENRHAETSLWCCNMLGNMDCECYSPEREMFNEYFNPGFKVTSGGWWECHECEPRMLALLLCAEMLRR